MTDINDIQGWTTLMQKSIASNNLFILVGGLMMGIVYPGIIIFYIIFNIALLIVYIGVIFVNVVDIHAMIGDINKDFMRLAKILRKLFI